MSTVTRATSRFPGRRHRYGLELFFAHDRVRFALSHAVGPVRIDFGYQLNPARYQGIVFPSGSTVGVSKVLQLPHLGFFFNIGPIF